MSNRGIIHFFAAVLMLWVFCAVAAPRPLPWEAAFEVSYTQRTAEDWFSGAKAAVRSNPPGMVSFGGVIARRVDGRKLFRAAPEICFRRGTVLNDSLHGIGDAGVVSWDSRWTFTDIGAEIPLGIAYHAGLTTVSVLAGPGIHLVSLKENFTEPGSKTAYDPGYEGMSLRSISPDLSAHFVLDQQVSKTFGFTIGYTFRASRLMQFVDGREFVLNPAEHTEYGFSHALRVGILFAFSD